MIGKKYKKRVSPEVIAIQWLDDNLESVEKFLIMNKFGLSFEVFDKHMSIEDEDGYRMNITVGDWIFINDITWSGMDDINFNRLYVSVEGDES